MGIPIRLKRANFLLLAALVVALAGSLPGWGQSQAPAKAEEPTETFRVSVDVVNVFFNVKDKRGGLVPSLTQADFEIYEDSKPQTIKYFSSESNQPLTLGLLLDTSGSVQRTLGAEKEVGMAFLNEVLGPKDLAFLISFDVGVDLLQDFTNSRDRLRKAFQRARINTGGGTGTIIPGGGGNPVPTAGPRGGTKLFDALYLGAHEKLASEVGRKAMILITDGHDDGSYYTLRQAVEAAQRADTVCYVLLLVDVGFYGSVLYVGRGDMEKLTEQTGGRVIDVDRLEKLKPAFDQIALELRSQYNLGYTPTNNSQDGTFRKIEIKSVQKHKVQARRGYYATKR